ncbi:MAG: hypothetical protein SynsKO_16800 [Synoicihabitans sp.]
MRKWELVIKAKKQLSLYADPPGFFTQNACECDGSNAFGKRIAPSASRLSGERDNTWMPISESD